jgi:ribosomal-protein-alanine N-acetyltransferase
MHAPENMLVFNFSEFPILTTERLVLRRITMLDLPEIFGMRKDPSLMNFISRPVARTEEDAAELIDRVDAGIANNDTINWGITMKGNDKVIGVVGFVRSTREHHRAEVGYLLSKDFHRKGIMTEALRVVLEYGFNVMGLHLAEAITDPRNIASAGVLEKLGFIREGLFKENFHYQGEFLDSAHFMLLRSRFK